MTKYEINENVFEFIDKFKDLLLKYYKNSDIHATINIKLYANNDINDIIINYKDKYNLNFRDVKDIKKILSAIGAISISKKNDGTVMFISLNTRIYEGYKILIIIKSNDIISRYDEFIIENIFINYESEFLITGYRLK